MAYNNNIPQPTDRINTSQPQLLANFQAIPVLLAVNHFSFGDPDEGKHKFITFAQLPTGSTAVPTAPLAGSTDVNIYSKSDGVNPQLYLQRATGTTLPTNYPFTGAIFAIPGYTYLPSGIVIKWGSKTVLSGSSSTTINTTTDGAGPVLSTILYVTLTPQSGAGTPDVSATLTSYTAPNVVVSVSRRTATGNTTQAFNILWCVIGTV